MFKIPGLKKYMDAAGNEGGSGGSDQVEGDAQGKPTPDDAGQSNQDQNDDASDDTAAEGDYFDDGDQPKIPEGYIKPLGEDASDDDISAFNKALGVPESVDGYKVDKPENITDEELASYKETALELGMTPRQAAGYVNKQAEAQKLLQEQAEATKKATVETLKREWGDNYTRNSALANEVANKHMTPEIKAAFAKSGVKDTVEFRMFCASFGQSLGEDGLAGKVGDTSAGVENPYTKGKENLTKQLELETNQPDLAATLKAAAGKSEKDIF